MYYPPARIKELRNDGHNIITLRRQVKTEAGVSHSLGLYVLMPDKKQTDAQEQAA